MKWRVGSDPLPLAGEEGPAKREVRVFFLLALRERLAEKNKKTLTLPSPASGRGSSEGFTLVELLVALLIFGMLSAAGVALLSFSVRAQGVADERLEALAEIRRTGALLTSDLAQAAPRITRDEAGLRRRAFEGGSGQGDAIMLSFVRRGWENMDGSNRSSLQKVQYLLSGDALQRRTYTHLDGAAAGAPATLIDGVSQLRLRYRDEKGEWRERWDPVRLSEMPKAVEMVIDVEDSGSIRQLFLVGTAA